LLCCACQFAKFSNCTLRLTAGFAAAAGVTVVPHSRPANLAICARTMVSSIAAIVRSSNSAASAARPNACSARSKVPSVLRVDFAVMK
jgi:hypothetical protein